MRRIAVGPRVTYWTEPHPRWQPNPEWPEQVGCVLYRGEDALVFVDPLIRDDLDATGWAWLDAEVETAGHAVIVLLTAPWHVRSTPAAVERYGARVWAAPTGRARAGDLPWLDDLPSGVEVVALGGRDEGQVAFWFGDERVLVVAEFFAGRDSRLVTLVSPAETDVAAFAESLDALRELPVEHVLVAHGEPVIGDGSRAIAAALDDFRTSRLP